MKTLLWIGTALYFAVAWWWYVCPHKKVCPFGTKYSTELSDLASQSDRNLNVAPSETDADFTDESEALIESSGLNANLTPGSALFEWSSTEISSPSAFKSWLDSTVQSLGARDQVEIKGQFHADEDQPAGGADLGLLRANNVRELLGSAFPDDRVRIVSEPVPANLADVGKAIVGVVVRPLINNETIIELPDRIIINFPHASDDILENPQLNEYLDQLVQRLSQTSEKVHLVGHTDNTASVRRNNYLGMLRADAVKNLLVSKGVSADRITTESMGESTPIATNNTAEGRKKNRRVELTIISS